MPSDKEEANTCRWSTHEQGAPQTREAGPTDTVVTGTTVGIKIAHKCVPKPNLLAIKEVEWDRSGTMNVLWAQYIPMIPLRNANGIPACLSLGEAGDLNC